MNILYYDSVKSTNLVAKELLNKYPLHENNRTVIVARKQTQGKGRSGTWFSPEDCGIYMSIIRPPQKLLLEHIEFYTELIGRKLNTIISNYFQLKTYTVGTNDIYLAERKLAGILCEYHPATDKLIIGIGINTFRPNRVRNDLKQSSIWLNEYAAEHRIVEKDLIEKIATELLKK